MSADSEIRSYNASAETVRSAVIAQAQKRSIRLAYSDWGINVVADTVPAETNEQRFRRLADQWHKDTSLSSSITQDHAHPAYLKILVMGKSALPLILKELRDRGGNWFLALRLIADYDPVPDAHAGIVKKMREDWIAWGRQHGYL